MIKIENTEVMGWEHAIRGMRNPMNSWDKSDSGYYERVADDLIHPKPCEDSVKVEDDGHWLYFIGPNDQNLMTRLAKGGPVHAKYRRMITVYCDITAPLYFMKELETYKVGTVANSCSTMHRIHAKEFTLEDFSHEHVTTRSLEILMTTIKYLNECRDLYVNYETHDNNGYSKPTKKEVWWQMIQLLPTSYNQKRTVMLNYEVLHNIYISRKDHKLDEWREFCKWVESLPLANYLLKGETNDV